MELKGRQDFVNFFYELVKPLERRYSHEKAGLYLGDTAAHYESGTIPMEGFSRILWGLIPLWREDRNALPEFQEIYVQGLSAGTNPENSEYWGGFRDFDQHFVEMAAISYGLLFVPDILWEPLSSEAKDNLVLWLDGINHYHCPDGNWKLFGVMVNLALKKLGRGYSEEVLNHGLERMEAHYLGGGWYQDGDPAQRDYYISFAFHFYSLIYVMIMEKEEPVRCRAYKKRAMEFARDFIYWFGEGGEALPFGRSLTYRFAQCSFWSALLMAGLEPFSVGIMKGIIVRNLDEWFLHPILDRDGILTIGYRYPNLHMAESYNAPGSPYWSFKAFAILGLPKEHLFWSTEALPLPALEKKKAIPYANMIVTRQVGNVCAYVPGIYNANTHAHANCKYSKFVYSTKFGFSVPRSNLKLEEAAPDSMLAFRLGNYIFVRRISESYRVEADKIYSKWVPFQGITVETTIIPDGNGHVRIHEIESVYDCEAFDCGFSVAIEEDNYFLVNTGDGLAQAENHSGSCRVMGAGGLGEVVMADPNTNLLANRTVIPAVRYELHKGKNRIETRVETNGIGWCHFSPTILHE